jgi:hypothetical protein
MMKSQVQSHPSIVAFSITFQKKKESFSYKSADTLFLGFPTSPETIYFLCKLKQVLSFPGSQAKEINPKPLNVDITAPTNINTNFESSPAPAKKVVGINEPQTCRNKGCGKTFKEKDNHETACSFHPGPAVFHDRMRGVRYPFFLSFFLSLFFFFFFLSLLLLYFS